MAVKFSTNVDYKGIKPFLESAQFATIALRDAFDKRGLSSGHIAYVLETKKHYVFKRTNESTINSGEWVELLPEQVAQYDDSEIKRRLETLEGKADNDTVYDDSELKRRVAELERRPVAQPAQEVDLGPIIRRLDALESKPDNDTVYDDAELRMLAEAANDAAVRAAGDAMTVQSILTPQILNLETKVRDLEFSAEEEKQELSTLESKVSILESKVSILESAPATEVPEEILVMNQARYDELKAGAGFGTAKVIFIQE